MGLFDFFKNPMPHPELYYLTFILLAIDLFLLILKLFSNNSILLIILLGLVPVWVFMYGLAAFINEAMPHKYDSGVTTGLPAKLFGVAMIFISIVWLILFLKWIL
jgi:hypothetical protein